MVTQAIVSAPHGTEKINMTLGSAKSAHHALVMVESTWRGSTGAFSLLLKQEK